jgi:hypothetical protein
MREPSRFAERDDIKGRLLRAARGEPSSDHARRRAAATVIAASTLVSSTAATTAAAGGAAAVVTKWVVAGAVVATLGGGAAVVVHERVHARAPTATTTASHVETARPALPIAAAQVASQASVAAEEPAPPLASAPPAVQPEPPSPAARSGAVAGAFAPSGLSAENARPAIAPRETPRAPSLTDELVALDSAKRLLDQGDSTGVLIALDRYARDFPAGRLQPEALALRAEALERHGDHALAVHLYERLVREYPESPLCERVRAIVGARAAQ